MGKNDKIPNEDRTSRFKRVAEKRTEGIIKALRILGNCSNKSSYQYSDEQIAKIFRAIEEQLRLSKTRFHNSRGRKKFTLN